MSLSLINLNKLATIKIMIMKIASITKDIEFNDNKPAISVLFESDHTKEIRIVMKTGQQMKEHKTKFPIVAPP